VKDRITGFTGVVTGRCEYITGCNQLLVQPHLKTDGDFQEPRWLDVDRAELLDAPVVTLPLSAAGPDRSAPIK
jgi:hypothetical protein